MTIKKKIVTFEISSKKKIILISLKKNLTDSNLENLGATQIPFRVDLRILLDIFYMELN